MKVPEQIAMPAGPPRLEKLSPSDSDRSIRVRLAEAEQALAAIRMGEVDALVVGGPQGERVFTLDGAEHGYRVLMEAMSEGVATVNDQGLITYCNARFTAIVHARPELTVGNPVSRFVPAADQGRFDALMAAGTTGRSEGEFWLRAPCASAPALVRLAVVSLTMDGARSHCLVMSDLTEQRRQSAEIAAERAQMQTRLLLADRMSSLGTLAAGVAHEINNPLAQVIASHELMSKRLTDVRGQTGTAAAEPTDWLRRQLERAQAGTERVRLIVRGLQAFTQADDETLGVIDPRHALNTSITLVSSEIRDRARLVTDYQAVPAVWANEARLGQVFLGLLVNATQAIPPGAAAQNEIRVSGRSGVEGCAVIEVRDTGSGIEPHHLARIFDPFFSTRPVNGGPGLGLALCHAIVSSLRGQITVESEPGKGSVFRVMLPGVVGVVSAAPASSAAAPAMEPRERLLFIDDEEDMCSAIQEALAPSHDVLTATSGRQALEVLAAGRQFDLILCDVRMPEMTGIDFYARLETDNPAQASHVVLMSAGFTRRPEDPAITLPGRVLKKPFELEQVLSLMRDALRAIPPPRHLEG